MHHKPHHSQEMKIQKVVHTAENPITPPLQEKVVPAVNPGDDDDDVEDELDEGSEVPRRMPTPAFLKDDRGGIHKPSHGDKAASMSDVYFLGERQFHGLLCINFMSCHFPHFSFQVYLHKFVRVKIDHSPVATDKGGGD